MVLTHLHIFNYKNIQQADLTLSPGINCFVGMNGSGKTNLIDAVYYLSFCKSFINTVDGNNINFDADFFLIQGNYDNNGRPEEVSASFKKGQKKVFKRNKKEYERLSDHIGNYPLVVISPADEILINGGSEERRRYMDSVISQFDNHYLNLIIRYSRLILQRNALLKDFNPAKSGAFLDIYDGQLVELAGQIYMKRLSFIEKLRPIFQRYYSLLSNDKEAVAVNYNSHFQVDDFAATLLAARERDIRYGYSTKGVHRDELDLELSKNPIRKYGSQGQKKSFLIALKLAHFELVANEAGVVPILLLDDVFDKLDSQRGESLIKLVSLPTFKQIFITDTQKSRLTDVVIRTGKSYTIFDVQNGQISKSDN